MWGAKTICSGKDHDPVRPMTDIKLAREYVSQENPQTQSRASLSEGGVTMIA